MWRRFQALGRLREQVVGINARNLSLVFPLNPRRALRMADDKLIAKEILEPAGVPVPETLCVVSRFGELAGLPAVIERHAAFAVKPATGSRGAGILIVKRDEWGQRVTPTTSGNRPLATEDILDHVAQILAGLVTPARLSERAFLEQLLQPDEVLGAVSYHGLPDVRVIVCEGRLVMAMARLPTRRSAGRANLHQGALGMGIDLETGMTTHAILGNRRVDAHPDTGRALDPIVVPDWPRIMEISLRAAACTDLGFVGVDVVVDRDRGPLVVELNARPGLSIQLANRTGLRRGLEKRPS
jgi:alpha-L-glutamate ligase-like protein